MAERLKPTGEREVPKEGIDYPVGPIWEGRLFNRRGKDLKAGAIARLAQLAEAWLDHPGVFDDDAQATIGKRLASGEIAIPEGMSYEEQVAQLGLAIEFNDRLPEHHRLPNYAGKQSPAEFSASWRESLIALEVRRRAEKLGHAVVPGRIEPVDEPLEAAA